MEVSSRVEKRGKVRISFCITCKGRLHHLVKTLPINIISNGGDKLELEYVLVDYSSPDGLREWVRLNMMNEIKSGLVSYYYIENVERFIPAHAKNVAHRLAQGEIVCNLDADNFCGEGFSTYLNRTFSDQENVYVRSAVYPGVSGRIAFFKKHFEMLGGYDEEMNLGWGYDDVDISERAIKFGLLPHVVPQHFGFLNAIPHNNSERTAFTYDKRKRDSHYIHRALSRAKIAAGIIVANKNKQWGAATVEKNFTYTYKI